MPAMTVSIYCYQTEHHCAAGTSLAADEHHAARHITFCEAEHIIQKSLFCHTTKETFLLSKNDQKVHFRAKKSKKVQKSIF